MSRTDATSWTILHDAASGNDAARTAFIRRYLPAVRAYLSARWEGTALRDQLEDAVQEVFLQFLEPGGVLEGGLGRVRGDSFRAYLYGLVRNVARMWERRELQRRDAEPRSKPDLDRIDADETRLSRVFDRRWARSIIAEAVALLRERAESEEALQRVELLHLRFTDNLPIREIADRDGSERTDLYRQMERARAEFMKALADVLCRQSGEATVDVEREGRRLIDLLR